MAKIELDGLDELEDFLNELKIDPPEAKAAVRDALNVIKAEVEPHIPDRTGALKRSQKISVRQDVKGVTTGQYKLDEFYAGFRVWH